MAANAKSKYEVLDRIAPAQPEPIEVPRQELPAAHTATPPAARSVGRPVKAHAKSKDPNMKGFTLILNIDTHADASAILKKRRTEGDMSDLVGRLLADWVRENKPKS